MMIDKAAKKEIYWLDLYKILVLHHSPLQGTQGPPMELSDDHDILLS